MRLLNTIKKIKEKQSAIRNLKRSVKLLEQEVKDLFELIAKNIDIEKDCVPLDKSTCVKGQIVVIKDGERILVEEIDDILMPPVEEHSFIATNNVVYRGKDAFVICPNCEK